jgi:hypothetical protein
VLFILLILMGYHLHVASKTIAGIVAGESEKQEKEERWIHSIKIFRREGEREGSEGSYGARSDSDETLEDGETEMEI